MRLWPQRSYHTGETSGAGIRRWLIVLSTGYVLLILIVAWFADSSKRQAAENVASLTEISDQQREITQLILDVSELERRVLVFRLTDNTAVTKVTDRLYDRIVERRESLQSRLDDGPALEILQRLGRHIESFHNNFTVLVERRQAVHKLVDNGLLANREYIATLLDEVVGLVGADTAGLKSMIELSASLARLSETESQFILDPYTGRGQTIRQYLAESIDLVTHLELSSTETANLLLQELKKFERNYAQLVQRNRGDLYLANVVMAGSVDEIQRLANRLTALSERELVEAHAAANSEFKEARRNDLIVLVIAVLFTLGLVWELRQWLVRMGEVEAGLRKSEARFRSTFDQAAVGIAHISFSGEWLRVNQKVCDILGYSMPELADLTFQDITHPEDLNQDSDYVKQVLAGEINTYDMEKRYFRKNGQIIWVNLTVSLVREEDGQDGYFVSVIEDISARKEAEEKLSHALSDLAYSNRELQQFAYVASHDLQEPLRMVVSFLGLIESEYADKLDDDGREYIHYAVDGGKRMKALIQGLLEYSRVQGQGKAIAAVDTEVVLDDALANLKLAIEDAEVEITREPLPNVDADADQLMRLFQNLVGNAIKFRGDTPPRIHISCRPAGEAGDLPEGVHSDDQLFCVQDNGLGFEDDEKEQVFKMFKRLHARSEHPGSGIGLAVCQRIVERHGGKIWASSEPGKGSRFFFTLSQRDA
ncbi:Phytochrome-like protein cph1 [Halioglobus japonicus]|nr:Phytochrome-like protein cph1 [Halioglobus japonicus]